MKKTIALAFVAAFAFVGNAHAMSGKDICVDLVDRMGLPTGDYYFKDGWTKDVHFFDGRGISCSKDILGGDYTVEAYGETVAQYGFIGERALEEKKRVDREIERLRMERYAEVKRTFNK